jgi:hypothetical protein
MFLGEIPRQQYDPDITAHDPGERLEDIDVKSSGHSIFKVGTGRIVLIAQGADRFAIRRGLS